MRHLNRGRKLSRTSSHRKAMFRNMVASLFTHGKIVTTPAKAKEARPFAEKLITLAKRGPGDLAARRRAISLLHDVALVRSLFEDIALRYKDRNGGYTRILHLAKTRVGDGSKMVLFELVEGGAPAAKEGGKKERAAVEPARVEEKPAVREEKKEEAETEETPSEEANAEEANAEESPEESK